MLQALLVLSHFIHPITHANMAIPTLQMRKLRHRANSPHQVTQLSKWKSSSQPISAACPRSCVKDGPIHREPAEAQCASKSSPVSAPAILTTREGRENCTHFTDETEAPSRTTGPSLPGKSGRGQGWDWSLGSWASLPGFKSWLCLLAAVCPGQVTSPLFSHL